MAEDNGKPSRLADIASGGRQMQPRFNLAAEVLAYEDGAARVKLLDEGVAGTEMLVTLRSKESERITGARPEIEDLEKGGATRRVEPGGVVMLEGLQAASDGNATARWIKRITSGASETCVVLSGQVSASQGYRGKDSEKNPRTAVQFADVEQTQFLSDLSDESLRLAVRKALESQLAGGGLEANRKGVLVRIRGQEPGDAIGMKFPFWMRREQSESGEWSTESIDEAVNGFFDPERNRGYAWLSGTLGRLRENPELASRVEATPVHEWNESQVDADARAQKGQAGFERHFGMRDSLTPEADDARTAQAYGMGTIALAAYPKGGHRAKAVVLRQGGKTQLDMFAFGESPDVKAGLGLSAARKPASGPSA